MRWFHFSAEPLQAVEERKQWDEPSDKPCGLWISDVDDYCWSAWCVENEFNEHGLEHQVEVVLHPEARVLHLKNLADMIAFEKLFAAPSLFADDPSMQRLARMRSVERGPDRIHWKTVAEQYDGILITPYQWARRLTAMYYYGWDCASGCIWHPRAIERVGEAQEVMFKQPESESEPSE